MEKTDNRTNGGRFEQALSIRLADGGFWVHVIQQNQYGQPADIIAVKGKYHTLIDCKVISDRKGFPFERVEENQKYAMQSFQRKAKEMCYFALRLPDASVWMLSMERIRMLKGRGKTRLTEAEIPNNAWPLDRWLKASDTWAEDD